MTWAVLRVGVKSAKPTVNKRNGSLVGCAPTGPPPRRKSSKPWKGQDGMFEPTFCNELSESRLLSIVLVRKKGQREPSAFGLGAWKRTTSPEIGGSA